MTLSRLIIQPYTSADEAMAYHLWRMTLGQQWPLPIKRFHQIITAPHSHHLTAWIDQQLVGFLASYVDEEKNGHISAILVAPALQRCGVGTALYRAAMQHMHTLGIQEVFLGRGEYRFWPGVPENLPAAQPFFEKLGWTFPYPVYDLKQDLHTYTTPAGVKERVEAAGVHFSTIGPEDVDQVLAFEQREFPKWLNQFTRVAGYENYQDILIGRTTDGTILASLTTYSAASHSERRDVLWHELLGDNVGAIACVGVAETERGRGIGLALVARASELLRDRGAGICSIDWVTAVDFYAKLGYHQWRGYLMSERS